MKSSHGKLEWVDMLRGMAALSVVVFHGFVATRSCYPEVEALKVNNILGLLTNDFINLGKLGVVVFFFISGYLIPFSLFNKNLKQFAVSRFFRLYPAYWFSLILWVIIIGMPPLTQWLANLTMFQKFIGIEDLSGVFWTLQIELIFYFVCAGMFYFNVLDNYKQVEKGYYVWLAVSLIMAAARFLLERKLPVALPLGLGVMFLGLMARLNVQSERLYSKKLIFNVCLYIAILLPTCLLAYNKDYGFDEKWYKHFVSYVVAFIAFFVVMKYKWHNKATDFLANISYSLYLLHPITGMFVVNEIRLAYPQYVGPLSFWVLIIVFSILSAIVTFYLIEKPAIALGKKAVNRFKENKLVPIPNVINRD